MAQATTLFTTQNRQALFYILLFSMTGANLPFMPVWLDHHGMTGEQIGMILAVPLLFRAVSGPVSGLWADRFALYRTPMMGLAAAAALFYALMGLSELYGPWRFAAFLTLYACAYTCSTSLSPMLDSMTWQLSRSHGFNYAIPRSVGSFAFVVAEVLLGVLLVWASPDLILWWVVIAVAIMAVSGRFVLPPEPRQDLRHLQGSETAWQRLRVLLGNRGLFWLLLAVGCLQASHSFYYAFSTLIWKADGLSTATCGYLWAVGVVGEIAFMMFADRFRRRVGPWRMLILAAVLAVARWGIMAFGPPLWLLWPLQLLHIFSFAAVYFAGLELIYRLAPKGYEGLAQTVNAAYANGVMMGIGTMLSGAVFAAFGVGGYGLMASLAGVGLLSAGWLYLNRERFGAA
jgi:MFS transporter, PPP family, 3-phenylpropionic acid transporter